MRMLVRHVVSIAALPFVMALVIPVWLARNNGVHVAAGQGLPQLVGQAVGVVLIVVGLLLFASSLRRFATEGEGTLAPWDPPRHLVVYGPYRYVRNPMISGVVLVLFGEAAILRSQAHLIWALTFLGVNAVYIRLLEEPQLKRRFGDAYVEYCRHVPGLIPRLRPWQPSSS